MSQEIGSVLSLDGMELFFVEKPSVFQELNERYDEGDIQINLRAPIKKIEKELCEYAPGLSEFAYVAYNFYGEKVMQVWARHCIICYFIGEE